MPFFAVDDVVALGAEEEDGVGTEAVLVDAAALPKNAFIPPPEAEGFLIPSDEVEAAGVEAGFPKKVFGAAAAATGRPLSPPPDCLDAEIFTSDGGSMRP